MTRSKSRAGIPLSLRRSGLNRRLLPMLALVAAMGLGACKSVRVTTRPEAVTREGIRSAGVLRTIAGAPASALGAFAERSAGLLQGAVQLEARGKAVDAAGRFLEAALDAWEVLAAGAEPPGSESEQALVTIHNNALARFVELWIADPRRLEPGPYRLRGDGVPLEISLAGDSDYPQDYFDRVIAARSIRERGIARVVRDGLGAPFVGIREQQPERAMEMRFLAREGLHLPVTVVIDSVRTRSAGGATGVVISLRNPLSEQTAAVGSRTFPLAANFSAPFAVILDGQSEGILGLKGFFHADRRGDASGIFLVEPYDPKRIPVVLIHGLVSAPMIWRDIVPKMMADPEIARRYQFMAFGYPSGIPVVDSASLLRDRLAELRAHFDPEGRDPLSRDMVVVGHSMGGILTHTLVAEIGDNLWNQISRVPIEEWELDPADRDGIRRKFFFDPDPAVRRAVFFSVPHRGAKKANMGIADLLSRLARLPANTLRTTAILLDPRVAPALKVTVGRGRVFTSAQSLRPGSPFAVALDVSPFREGVVFHSIIGDRGRGDTPNSSDGVVEYWSSHQEGAASELIVPSGHASYRHPLGIEELRRILREHVGIR